MEILYHIETSQLISNANQLSGFCLITEIYMNMITIFTESYFRTDYTYLVQVFPTFSKNLSTLSSEVLASLISDHCKEYIKNRQPISQRKVALELGWRFIFLGEDTLDMPSKVIFVSS